MLPKVIPQSVLFGNPDKAEPKMSPNGTQYAYLANSDKGVLNVFVQALGDEAPAAKQITNDTHRGIRMFEWAKNNKCVLYLQDADGDENWHIYAADLATGVVRDMTPFQGIRADNLKTDKNFPDEAIVGLNVRDRSAFDLYRLDLVTGALVFHTTNPGNVSQWLVDADFRVRGCVANDQKDGSKILKVRDTESDEWREIASWPNEETAQFYRFTADGTGIFVATSMAHGAGDARDTTRLVILSAKDGSEVRELFFDARCDIDEVIFNDAHEVEAVVVDYDKQEWKVQKNIAADIQALLSVCTGTLRITSRSTDDAAWIVSDMRDDGSPRYFLYTRANQSATLLFLARPALEAYTLVKMSSHVITTSDGEKMVVLRTLPSGLDPVRLPLVLLVHGGPWARDHWGWNAQAQWLSNRGYACLMVNFRASTGYGKRWLHLGDGQWGASMQQDLSDAVAWAIKEGFADASRVAIMGGSYGGYATLAGLAFTPELYCCGVDIVGPAHLRTLLQSIPPYWAPMKKMLTLRVGDVENDDALNEKCSPMYHAAKMSKPLLIAQGANDPRVKKAESDQMVSAMHKAGTAVEYVLYADEGHGFARPQNRVDFYLRTERFLAKYCGGRVGPDEPELTKGNSAQVLDPASIVL